MATTDGTTPHHVSTTLNNTHTADTVVALGGEGGRYLPTLHQPQEQHQHLLPSSDHLPTYDIPAPSTTQPGSHFMGMYHHLPLTYPTAAVTNAPGPATTILGPVATTPTGTTTTHASLTIGPAIVAAAAAAAAAATGAVGGGGGGDVSALPAMAEDDAIWEDFYHRLVQFREWHGHTLVPRKYEADPKLSTWVEQQRAAWNRDYNNTKTTATSTTTQPVPMMMNEGSANQNQNQNQYSTTASLGLGEEEGVHHSDHQQDEEDDAIWNAVADMDNMTAATTTAATTTGLLLSPTGGGLVPYKKLSLERKQKLDAVGFVWSLRSKRIGDHWDEMFRQLVDYKNRHGDCLVPSRYEANMKLGKVRCVVLQE